MSRRGYDNRGVGRKSVISHALSVLTDPASAPADLRSAARTVDRAQTTSLATLPLQARLVEHVRRLLWPASGTVALHRTVSTAHGSAAHVAGSDLDAFASALVHAPGLEPLPAGGHRLVSVPDPELRRRGRATVRQGRLGDCWLVAVLEACEAAAPGHLRSLITADERPSAEAAQPGVRTAAVRLYSSALSRVPRSLPRSLPLLRRVPGLPLQRVEVRVSTRVPYDRRAGGAGLRPSSASLVEKAVVLVWAQGSYPRLARDFAGAALALVTGRWAVARPVPGRLRRIEAWLSAGRPVVASTLVRPGGSFTVRREDGTGRIAVMDGHVYAVQKVLRCDEDGRPGEEHPLRVHLRNPVGGPDRAPQQGRLRRTDLFLSARQLRRSFISVNVGPALSV